ncbi:hypothetical protein [Hahella chejuensis]|uniref:hypothetical protein n=1 Tax=Hahella chejuensis TaxID=158327 RepID=UPI00130545C6|nr:hypothetical protein [Hahella chejuensis]
MKQLLEHAKLSIENDPEHHLQLPIRKKLWLAIGPVEEGADGHAVRSLAYKTRVILST